MIQPHYEILTQRLPGEEVIAQQVNFVGPSPDDPMQEVRQTLLCQMLNVGEEQVKQRLIEMGWLPPDAQEAALQETTGAGMILRRVRAILRVPDATSIGSVAQRARAALDQLESVYYPHK